MPETVRLSARIHGFVQGVSFRYYALREARSLGITGWVRNRMDGSVEVLAEGESQDVHRLLSWLQHGPTYAQVESVDARWEQPTGEFRGFEVRY